MFPALFQTGKIGGLTLKNRLIMAAMGNSLADDKGCVTGAMLDYYRPRAKGGVGLVITQFAAVSRDDTLPYNLCLYDDTFTSSISRLVEEVHSQGARVCVQLMHPGMLHLLLKTSAADQQIKVPGITPLLPKERKYRELSAADIAGYTRDFILAAGRVKESGADAVEIHACHGCLLSTFLSPALNRRGDSFGGSIENRARFVQQIIAGIKEKTGQEFPLIVRINGDDDIPGGVTPGEVVRYAEIFQAAGADAVSISSGLEYWSTLMAPSYLTQPGIIIPIAAEVKKKVHIPVIIAGKINPALAERSLEEGKADFIALGRPLLADPGLPDKLARGDLKDIAQCLYCNNCLRTSWRSCTVNPFLYRESNASLTPAARVGKVMVVGGGPAGMQAAVLCRQKGYDVSLYEKESELGGQWRIACSLPGKGPYLSLINSLKHSLEKYGVKVTTGSEIGREQVTAVKPDILILATGASPAGVSFPGLSLMNAVQANDLIQGRAEASGKTVVLGNTILAMETALFLAEKGLETSLVSPGALGGRKGPDDMITFRGLLRRLTQLRVPLFLNTAVLEGSAGTLLVRCGEEILPIPCDTLVLAAGVQAVDKLSSELKGIVPDIYAIGDCVIPGNAAQATFSAARLALKL